MFRTQRKRLISARIGLLGGAALALACSPAFGQATTATANVGVSATVVPSCSISTSNLSFGNYTASSGTANTTTATLSFTCTSTTTWWIGLDAGTNSGSTSNPRIMSDGSGDSLNYDLYQIPAQHSVGQHQRNRRYEFEYGAIRGHGQRTNRDDLRLDPHPPICGAKRVYRYCRRDHQFLIPPAFPLRRHNARPKTGIAAAIAHARG